MSGKKHRRKKRRKHPRRRSQAAVLGAVAAALNACERAGTPVHVRYGAVWAEHGVILPPGGQGRGWEARVFTRSPWDAHTKDGGRA